MNSKKINAIAFENQEERDKLSDEMISLRFLGQVGKIMESENVSRKELASRLKTSPSYVTQLFQGDKLVNVRLLTRIKRALNVSIEITCSSIAKPIQQATQQLTLPQVNQKERNSIDWLGSASTAATLILNESVSYTEDIIDMGMNEDSVFVFVDSKSVTNYGNY